MSEESEIRQRIEECLNGPKVGKDLAYLTEVVHYKIQKSDSLDEKIEWGYLRTKLFEKAYSLSKHRSFLIKATFLVPLQLMKEYGHRLDVDLLNINQVVDKFLLHINHLDFEKTKSIGSGWQQLANSEIQELSFLRNCLYYINSLSEFLPHLDDDKKKEVMKWLSLRENLLR